MPSKHLVADIKTPSPVTVTPRNDPHGDQPDARAVTAGCRSSNGQARGRHQSHLRRATCHLSCAKVV